jgi:hypothetical protein
MTLFSGLTISAVAIYYSVAGLVAIFAAAVVPIIIMGVALEISKLAATIWLKQNWTRAPAFIKSYLLIAIAILMLITSMGIFGFLSKAHSDQSLVSGDVQSKIAIYDEKIKTAKDNIDANRKALKQMDESVDQSMARSNDERGADKAVALRRSQAKERSRLQQEIAAEQKTISALNDEAAPIRAEVRKVEAEVGPIKYIASFIYSDNPDANVLEKAVTWVIIIIVIVFDPLAVILLLASQYSFQWFRKEREIAELQVIDSEPVVQEHKDTVTEEVEVEPDSALPADESITAELTPKDDSPDQFGLEQWNKMIEEAEKAVTTEAIKQEDKFPLNPFMGQQCKVDDEDGSKNYVFNGNEWIFTPVSKEHAEEVDPVLEAKKWAEEQSEESKKKTTYIIKEGDHQIQKIKEQ